MLNLLVIIITDKILKNLRRMVQTYERLEGGRENNVNTLWTYEIIKSCKKKPLKVTHPPPKSQNLKDLRTSSFLADLFVYFFFGEFFVKN